LCLNGRNGTGVLLWEPQIVETDLSEECKAVASPEEDGRMMPLVKSNVWEKLDFLE
jgi:hypothetical protein